MDAARWRAYSTEHDAGPRHRPERGREDVRVSRAKLNELLNAVLPFAQQMLDKHGEFYPFAAALDPDGKVILVAGHPGEEHPVPSELRDFLEASLRQGAQEGRYTGTAVCFNATFTPTGGTRQDVVAVELEHESGDAVTVYLPYSEKAGEMQYGDVFASAATPKVFIAPD